jgi:hypothetical protein
MGWNGIGIGWPNATSGGSAPVPPEKYFVVDCIGYRGDAETIEYPAGTFAIGDRVVYDAGGISTFGLISNTATPEYTETEITGTGVNTNQCFDNTVIFTAFGYGSGNDAAYAVEIQSQDISFVSQEGEYSINFGYYVSGYCVIDLGEGETDERPVLITGTNTIPDYNYNQGGEYEILFVTQAMGYPVLNVYLEFVAQQPYFFNTDGFTDNDCDNLYFLRRGDTQYGSTFIAGFRNDDC